jgi:hypothetical protein
MKKSMKTIRKVEIRNLLWSIYQEYHQESRMDQWLSVCETIVAYPHPPHHIFLANILLGGVTFQIVEILIVFGMNIYRNI